MVNFILKLSLHLESFFFRQKLTLQTFLNFLTQVLFQLEEPLLDILLVHHHLVDLVRLLILILTDSGSFLNLFLVKLLYLILVLLEIADSLRMLAERVLHLSF